MIKKTVLFIAALVGSQVNAQTEIYNEDFQSGIPGTYTIVDNDFLTPNAAVSEYTDAWILLPDPDNAADSVMSSTSYFDAPGLADRWLITPPIALGAFGNKVYWEAKSKDASFAEDYYILVSKTDTQLSSFTDTLILIFQELETWQSQVADLSEIGMDNETVHLAFVNRTYDGFKLYIDDIRVEMEDPSSVNELTETQILTYPNPSSDIVNVTGIQDITSIEITSMSGSKLLESGESSINISSLATGRYILIARSKSTIARTVILRN
jgi:Secretion system C-terminal sorting domain/Cleaved Adhesin Domain